LNLQQYQSLCEACDRLLLEPKATHARVATPWLHFIRPHQQFIKYYTDIFSERLEKNQAFINIYKIIRQLLSHALNITASIFAGRNTYHACNVLPTQVDLLIVSHLISENHIGLDSDFYYGNLPKELIKSKINVAVVLINFTKKSALEISKIWGKSDLPIVILDKYLRPKDEVKMTLSMFRESLAIRHRMRKTDSDFDRRVIKRAAREANSSGARWALKTSTQIAEVTKNLSPKVIMITHEGHSWERVTFAKVRNTNPKILCIGYQHSIIFNLQHALMRDLAAQYNPDFVFTSGTIGANLLSIKSKKKSQSVAVLGSPRLPVKPQSILIKSPEIYSSREITCLVLPEGIIEECNMLFDFSVKCALMFSNMRFVWRLHPALSHEEVATQNPNLKNLPPNIYLSNRTIEEDIKDSQISLYRGSTAIITAVMAGVLPIYLTSPKEISIDTLWQLDGSSRAVTTPEQFKNLIVLMSNKDNCEFSSVIQKAQTLCKELLLPLDPTQLVKGFQQGFEHTGFLNHYL
jgi:hypothetical protein